MKKQTSDTIDLHGLRKDEVFDRIDQFLLQASEKGKKTVKIMTGKGEGIVKKETIAYLKKANYPWKYEKLSNGQDNQGVLVVFLD